MKRLGIALSALAVCMFCACTKTEYVNETLGPVTPLPQPEIEDDEPEYYDETKILKFVKDFSYWDGVDTLECFPDKFARGSGKVKIDSDAAYIYGYVEVATEKRSAWADMHSILNNLGVWIDKDGITEGQGGGWFMCDYKGMDILLRGRCATDYAPQQWNPEVCDVVEGGDNFGRQVESTVDWSNVGTGKGSFEDGLFRYTFTIDRTRLKLLGLESIGIGLSFDAGGYNDYAIIPTREGFQVKLNN